MKICSVFSISKAHSSVAKPKSIFFCSCNLHYFRLFYAPAKFDAVVLQRPVYNSHIMNILLRGIIYILTEGAEQMIFTLALTQPRIIDVRGKLITSR